MLKRVSTAMSVLSIFSLLLFAQILLGSDISVFNLEICPALKGVGSCSESCGPGNGIYCSSGNITGIWWHEQSLTGYLPWTSIAKLSSLNSLVLNGNPNLDCGPLPSNIGALTMLGNLRLSETKLSGTLPSSFSDLTALEHLYLHDTALSGPFPAGFENLSKMQEFFVQNCSLNGSLPDFRGWISLLHFNIAGNHLYGDLTRLRSDLPWCQLYGPSIDFNCFNCTGKPHCANNIDDKACYEVCLPQTLNPTCSPTSSPTSLPTCIPTMFDNTPSPAEYSSSRFSLTILVSCAVAAGIFLLVAIGLVVCLLLRRRKKLADDAPAFREGTVSNGIHPVYADPSKFELVTFDEIKFGDRIGSGSFGVVHRGEFNGGPVAVKMLKAEVASAYELADFRAEAEKMMKMTAHPNIVRFIGFCSEPPLILTELILGGSLETLLYSTAPIVSSDLSRIVVGCARGLAHLHRQMLIHRDIAARNVLLSVERQPKISDFGLAREKSDTESYQQTKTNIGPVRWMSPEQLSKLQYRLVLCSGSIFRKNFIPTKVFV